MRKLFGTKEKLKPLRLIRSEHFSFALGISLCLIGAFLMAFGEGLLGENHAGIATVIGIVGIIVLIGLIGTSGAMLSGRAALRPKN